MEPAPPSAPGAPGAPPQAAAPPAAAADLDQSIETASAMELASAPQSVAPYMIGDLFGISNNFYFGYQSVSGNVGSNNGTPLAGGRRLKIAETTSPMPRDRVFFSYNLFRGAYQTDGVIGGAVPDGGFPSAAFVPTGEPSRANNGFRNFDNNRFLFGVEKTFFGGMTSAEVRIPFAYGLGNSFTAGNEGVPGDQDTFFDNVSVALKTLLYTNPTNAVSAGVILNTPTAGNVNLQQSVLVQDGSVGIDTSPVDGGDITSTLSVKNQSLHVSPFLGYLWTPNSRLFVQSYIQFDLAATGNDVIFTPIHGGNVQSPQNRTLTDQNLFQADVAVGYWVYRNPDSTGITGFAPILECHYTTTITDADILVFNQNSDGSGFLPSQYQGIFGNTFHRLDIWNVTVGAAIQVGSRLQIGNGFVIPVSRGDGNNLFDWEYTLQLNYRYGPLRIGDRAPVVF